jgi:hypothetical protein
MAIMNRKLNAVKIMLPTKCEGDPMEITKRVACDLFVRIETFDCGVNFDSNSARLFVLNQYAHCTSTNDFTLVTPSLPALCGCFDFFVERTVVDVEDIHYNQTQNNSDDKFLEPSIIKGC